MTPLGLRRTAAYVACVVLMAGGVVACSSDSDSAPTPMGSSTGGLPQGSEPVKLDPADFTVDITNRYWPMQVGDRWVYEETDGEGGAQRVEVTVLSATKTVAAGVEARVVHDLVTEGAAVVEDTYDWYAQDSDGNVWYLGEDTTEYEDGKPVSTAGSWEAGVDGAQPGILLPAEPTPGLTYRQEYLAGEAEDLAVVLSVSERLETPTGAYTGVLQAEDTTPLEPDLAEQKYYAPGIGLVLVVQTAGGASRETLIETTRR